MNNVNLYRDKLMDVFKLNREFVSATGDWLYDTSGSRVYDACSQYGTQIFGHNDKELITNTIRYLQENNTNFIQPHFSKTTKQLLKKIARHLRDDFKHACLTNSGTESVEAVIKLARLKTGKSKIISLKGSFHGKTFTALSASGSSRYKVNGIFDENQHIAIEPGDISALTKSLSDNTVAGFIFEPVLGEGGMTEISPEFVHQAIALCKEYGVVTIADEIQCGLLRCGALIYSQKQGYGVDAILLGKGLSGGIFPIGLVLYSKKIYTKLFEKIHSSTYAGGGIACNVAHSVIDVLTRDETIKNKVNKLSYVIDKNVEKLLYQHKNVLSVSGVGLMRGIEFLDDHNGSNYFTLFIHNSGMLSYVICSYLLDKFSILTMPLMSKPCAIRFEPALTTSDIQIERFFEAMKEVATLISKGRYDVLMAHLADIDRAQLSPEFEKIQVENSDHPQIEPILRRSAEYHDFDFAFFIHTTSDKDLVKIFPRSMHEKYTPEQQLRMSNLLIHAGQIDPSPDVVLAFRVKSNVSSRKGLLIFSPLAPTYMMRLSPLEKLRLIDEYFERAMELGAKVIGLGAYTSVITRSGLNIADRYKGVYITTGNSLTAISTYEQFKSVYEPNGNSITAVIGARGSVGRLVTLSIINDVPKIILVGKSNTSINSYHQLIVELLETAKNYEGPFSHESITSQIKAAFATESDQPSPSTADVISMLCTDDIGDHKSIIVSSKVTECIQLSDYIISCTSEGKPFLDDRNLKNGAVALDAGRPFDFLTTEDTEATVYEAGLVRQPRALSYGDCNMVISEPGVNLACFSETIILSLEKAHRHYSLGKTIDYNDISEIRQMAIKNKFTTCLVEGSS